MADDTAIEWNMSLTPEGIRVECYARRGRRWGLAADLYRFDTNPALASLQRKAVGLIGAEPARADHG
jgi:hypothetical protein